MCLTYFLDLTWYCKAGNFRYLITEPYKKFWRLNARKQHPPRALHVKYRCVGVYPSFNFRVRCSTLEKRGFAHTFPAVRYQKIMNSFNWIISRA